MSPNFLIKLSILNKTNQSSIHGNYIYHYCGTLARIVQRKGGISTLKILVFQGEVHTNSLNPLPFAYGCVHVVQVSPNMG